MTTTIDFNATYRVSGYDGIAFYLCGYETVYEPITCYMEDEDGNEYEEFTGEFDKCENTERVVAVMVGDDRKFTFDVNEIAVLDEDDYCHECGQIGCRHDGRDRD